MSDEAKLRAALDVALKTLDFYADPWPHMAVECCALCQLFHPSAGPKQRSRYFADPSTMCEGCPVRDATGRGGCGGTPYDECERLDPTAEAEADLFLAAAKAELSFLQSLLPEA